MKYDPKKLFGYPVLRDALRGEDRSQLDYPKAEFQPDLKLTVDPQRATNAVIDYEYGISVPELVDLHEKGSAEFRLTASCNKTFWTESYVLDSEYGTVELDGAQLKDQIELNLVLITTREVELASKMFHSDYEGQTFQLPRHSILAWHNPVAYSVSQERFRSLRTLIDFKTAQDVQPGDMRIDTSEQYVAVTVHPNMYKAITLATKSSDLSKTVVLASVYHAVVSFMLTEMQAMTADDEDLDSRRWSMIVRDKCLEQNLDWHDPSSVASNAQRLLGTCFKRMVQMSFGAAA